MQKIRTALVGYGRNAESMHGAALLHHNTAFEVVAAVDPVPERRQKAEENFGCKCNLHGILEINFLD